MRRHATMGNAIVALTLMITGIMAAPKGGLAAEESGVPWLGVYSQSLTRSLREGLDYEGQGVLVNRVVDRSPADRAGLEKGDIIVSFNGRSLDSSDELTRLVRDARIGQTVRLSIIRDGDRRTITVRLGERPGDEDIGPDVRALPDLRGVPVPDEAPEAEEPEQPEAPETPEAPEPRFERRVPTPDSDDFDMMRLPLRGDMRWMGEMGRGRLGVRVQDLQGDLGEYFDVPRGRGVLILEVLPGTPAERAGLKSGDVITRVEGTEISEVDDLTRELRKAPAGKVSLEVMRKGGRRTIEAQLERAGTRVYRFERGPGMGSLRERDQERLSRRRALDESRDARDRELEQLREEVKELRAKIRELERD